MGLQKINERTLLSYADNFSKKTNLSAIVIENKTGKVISYIGSLDYFSQEKLGANNMVAAIRSPGSTLKLLYMQQQWIKILFIHLLK